MKFTSEQLKKAKSAKSVDELLKFAEEEGIELTKEDAEKYFAFLAGEDTELPEEALDRIAGGKGEDKKAPDPKYKPKDHVWIGFYSTANYQEFEVVNSEFYENGKGWRYIVQLIGTSNMQNLYLETMEYVHDSDPGPGWNF